jgi:hypothetical protein
MKTMSKLLATVTLLATAAAAQAQFGPPGRPVGGLPAWPGSGLPSSPFGPNGPGMPNRFGPQLPGLPGLPGTGVPGAFPNDPWGGLTSPFPGGGQAPFFNLPGAKGLNVQPGALSQPNPGAIPQIPPAAFKIDYRPVDLSKLNVQVPPGGSPAPAKPATVPAWLRWEWAVVFFVLSLLAGLVHGYRTRKQVSGSTGESAPAGEV